MQMLSSLLPGIREIRAPFVAGFIFLVALYLLLDKQITVLTQPSSADAGVKMVMKWLDSTGRLAVAGIVAYLVGALVLQAMQQIRYRAAYRLNAWTGKKYNIVEWGDKPREEWTLWGRLMIPFSRTSLVRLIARCNSDPILTDAVQLEIRRGGGKRLLVVNRDLYLEYDRLQSAAELRRAVAWPGVLLLAALVFSLSWPLWAASIGVFLSLVVLFGLGLDARLMNKEANSMYAHAVADRIVSTPSLEALEGELSVKSGLPEASAKETTHGEAD
jgi:hypothetical protein